MVLDSNFQFLGINRVDQNCCTYMIRGYVKSTYLNNILNIPTGVVWALERLKGKLLRFCEKLKMPSIHSHLVTGDAKCRLLKSLTRIPSLIEYTFVKWHLLKLLTCRPPFSSYSTKSRQFTFKPRFYPPPHQITLNTQTPPVRIVSMLSVRYTLLIYKNLFPLRALLGFVDHITSRFLQVFTGGLWLKMYTA